MDKHAHHRVDAAGLTIAVGLLVLAGLIWWDLSGLELSSVYGLGPKAMPIVVTIGIAILGVANGIIALRGGLPRRDSLDWKPIVLIIGGLGILIVFIKFGIGFIPATAILFAATSAAFGRRAFIVDLVIGFVVGVIIYLLFSKLLTLSLPMGPLERLI